MCKAFCPSCMKNQSHSTATKRITIPILGESQSITTEVLICSSCKTETQTLEEKGKCIYQALSIYREKHQLLSGDDLYSFRIHKGLSQQDIAKILGCDPLDIFRYETGSIIPVEHSHLLQQLINTSSISNTA